MKKLLSVSALALILAACSSGDSSEACKQLLVNYDELANKMPDDSAKEQIKTARGQLESALKSLKGNEAEEYCKQANAGFEQLKQAMDMVNSSASDVNSAPVASQPTEVIETVSETVIVAPTSAEAASAAANGE